MLITAARRTSSRSSRSPNFCSHSRQTPFSTRYEYSRIKRFVSLNSLLQVSEILSKKAFDGAHYPSLRRQMGTAFSFKPDDIPFENINSPPPSLMSLGAGFGKPSVNPSLGSIDVFSIRERISPGVLRRGRLGISGDFAEIIPVFEACVHVGRLERARNILDKLHDKSLSDYEAIRCTNIYLRAAVEQVIVNCSNESHMQELHRWFEVNHELKDVPNDSEMIAYMLKLSLQSGKGRRERLVRKYMDLLDEESFLELIESDILTGQETSLVTEIYPKYNFALESYEVTDDKKPVADTHHIMKNDNLSDTEILETEQKGISLRSLKSSLSLFDKASLEGVDLQTASHEVKREIQRKFEEDAVVSAISRWRDEHEKLSKMGLNSNLYKVPLGSLMWDWHTAMEQKIQEELKLIAEAEKTEKRSRDEVDRCSFGPLLQILPPSQLSALTIITCMTLMGQHNERRIPLSSVVLEIGKNIEDESTLFILQRLQKTKKNDESNTRRRLNPEFYMKLKRSRGPGVVSHHMQYIYAEDGIKPWPSALKAKLGATLMSHLIDVAKVTAQVENPQTKEELVQIQPAFTHAHQYKKGKKTGIILLNKVLIEKLKSEPVHSLMARQLPMIVPPDSWTGFRKGGYIAHPSTIMRIKFGDQSQRYYCEAAISQGNISKVFQGLDVLGQTAWRINKEVYKVMLEAWNTGKAIANLPPLNPQLEIPPEPTDTKDPLEKGRWIRQIKIMQNLKTSMHSQRCFQNFQLEIARAYNDLEFFFPHNIDFRGRAYPIHPYLNHIGADQCRGLLTFSVGKELGERGLKWLKIHTSNVFGFDKASLQEREDFTTSNLEEIYDSANYPMTGRKWWLKAENPWQFLAACIELKNALESPDPKKFVSHLPVHQDGTCNGLQHYAALGGDVWGAKQVNLEPGSRPADVYSAVAELVQNKITSDKQKGLPIAEYLDGKIARKTVKQTVMTNVYGVTFIGATAQVRKQLVAANPDLNSCENSVRMAASSYVAKMIFEALSTMFRGAHDIQYWLGECAGRISSSLSAHQIYKLESELKNIYGASPNNVSNSSRLGKKHKAQAIDDMLLFKSCVTWTSPLGLPVVQPYRASKGKSIRTIMQNLNLAEPQKHSPVCKRKQLQGFPPNFIHSLDASHMILSAIGCNERGMSFAAVHDSFWTHACDIDSMNSILREKFVQIHSNDIIGRLKAEFEARYKDSFYLARIKPCDSTRKAIVAWRRKFRASTGVKYSKINSKSLSLIQELLVEFERARLLSSTDPKKVEEGKSMITPGSIYNLSFPEGNTTHGGFEELAQELYSPGEQLDVDSNIQANLEDDEEPLDDTDMGVETCEDGEVVDEDSEADFSGEELSKFEKDLAKPNLKKSKKIEKFDQIWLPLSFPEVPKKVSSY